MREDPGRNLFPVISQSQVAFKAKITTEQGKKLVSVLGKGKDFEKNNVIVLPTFIPDGYTIDKLTVWQKKSVINSRVMGGHYKIVYKNAYGYCFLISGGETSPRGEGLEKYEEVSNIYSPALGSVKLGFTNSARADGIKSIAFAEPMFLHIKGRNEYEFSSPYSDCKMMNLQDAKRVVESLQFIDP